MDKPNKEKKKANSVPSMGTKSKKKIIQLPVPGGGGEGSRFQVTGMIESGQNQNQKKSLGLQTEPQKMPWPKI